MLATTTAFSLFSLLLSFPFLASLLFTLPSLFLLSFLPFLSPYLPSPSTNMARAFYLPPFSCLSPAIMMKERPLPLSSHQGNYLNATRHPAMCPQSQVQLHRAVTGGGSSVSPHFSPQNPTFSSCSIPGNPRGRPGGSAALHVTAARHPLPKVGTPPLPGTLRGRRGTHPSRAPRSHGNLGQPEGNRRKSKKWG